MSKYGDIAKIVRDTRQKLEEENAKLREDVQKAKEGKKSEELAIAWNLGAAFDKKTTDIIKDAYHSIELIVS